MNTEAQLDATFTALAHPARRAILARLSQGEASVRDLGKPFRMSQPAISKHLRVLERAGLVSWGRTGRLRPRKLEAKALGEANAYLEKYRQYWEGTYAKLDSLLAELQAPPAPTKPKGGKP